MSDDILIKKLLTSCPICENNHEIEIRRRNTEALIKKEKVEYEEIHYLCNETEDEENEYYPAGIMDENLKRARESYLKKEL